MPPETNPIVPAAPKSALAMPIAIVIAGLLIAGAIYFSESNKTETPVINQDSSGPQTVDIKNVKTAGQPFIGNPNAPVTIAYWFDYQCPFCKMSEQSVIAPLVDDYIKTGKVKLVFKDFQFLGPDSQTIALTARAIWEAYPDKFYEWNKVMFENQGQENTGWATKAVIVDLTSKVSGIDQAVIDSLLVKNSAKYQKAIDSDKTEAKTFGISGTPGFILSDQLIPGVPNYGQLSSFIDTLLK